eukprot:461403-Alexandrium_andersonii.AAC.1
MDRSLEEAAGGLAGGSTLGGGMVTEEVSSGDSEPDYENSEASHGIDAREEPEDDPDGARPPSSETSEDSHSPSPGHGGGAVAKAEAAPMSLTLESADPAVTPGAHSTGTLDFGAGEAGE